MPFITYEGPLIPSQEKREELAQGITNCITKVLGIPSEDVVVLVKEQGGPHMSKTPRAVSVGGRFVSRP